MVAWRRILVLGSGAWLTAAMACDPKPAARANVTVEAVVPPHVDSVVPEEERTWRERDGAFLIVAGDDMTDGTLVPPPTTDGLARGLPQGLALRADLLGRGGVLGTASLEPIRPATVCGWARIRVVPRDLLGEDHRWTIALAPGVARPVSLDSLERFDRADSSRLVADLARLLSALPDDTVPRFRGLPFSVRGAWRFAAAPGAVAVVAEVHRRVAQEANPLEERLIVIAERDSFPASRWRILWGARAQGSEESVETLEALAVIVIARDAFPTVVVGHDTPVGTWTEFVARDSTGAWRGRWRSPRPLPCGGGVR